MNLVVDLLDLVFLPLVGLPQGVTGWRPPEVRPSPPPCGWSTGFIVTPRLCGLCPNQRLRPAFSCAYIVTGSKKMGGIEANAQSLLLLHTLINASEMLH